MKLRRFLAFLIVALALSAAVYAQCTLPKDIFFGMTVHYPTSFPAEATTVSSSIYRSWDFSPGSAVTWQGENTAPGVYDFTGLDQLLIWSGASSHDFLYTFGIVPTWISSNSSGPCGQGNTGTCYPPSDISTGNTAFKNFVTAVVQHSLASRAAGNGYIKYYEVWNEPKATDVAGGNCPPSCGTWNGTMAQFLIMANTEYTVIHNLDPNAQLVGPALSHCGDALDKINFMNQWFAGGGGAITQAITCHAYEGIQGTAFSLINSMNGVKASEATYGINLPIWFTEGDCEQAPSPCTTDPQKVAFLGTQTFVKLGLGVQRDIYYAWDGHHGDELSGAQLVAYQQLESWLIGSTFSGCTQNGDSNQLTQWTCTLILPNQNVAKVYFLVGFGITGSSTTATISAGNYTHYQTLNNGTINNVSGGVVTIGAAPIMLTP